MSGENLGTKATVINNNVDFYRRRMKSADIRFFQKALKLLEVVIMTFSRLCFVPSGWVGAVALLSAVAVCADDAETHLAPGLSVLLPESMAVRDYRSHSSDDYPILVGDLDGEPAYFLGAVKVRRWERSNVLWTKLETELRYIDPSDNLSVITRGGFTTGSGHEVRYRGYRFQHKDGFRRQVYFLLRSDSQIYWLTLTMIERADLGVVIPLAQALVKRTRLADDLR